MLCIYRFVLYIATSVFANNNFYPSSSITRYRLAASGNNSVTLRNRRVRKRASSVLFFSPGPRQENRVSRNRVLTNSVLNERKLSTAVCAEIIFSSTIRLPMDKFTSTLGFIAVILFSDVCVCSLFTMFSIVFITFYIYNMNTRIKSKCQVSINTFITLR